MSFSTTYNSVEQIYNEHLSSIKGLKFTFREIDLLACILHNRGEKKIASLLLVSPRTVSVHVYNIMNKLGCNSKDQIIDFIEGSGKLAVLREYYLHLLVKANFERLLIKVGSHIHKTKINLYCHRGDILSISNQLYQSIQKHFRLTNFILLENQDQNNEIVNYLELTKITTERYYHDILDILSSLLPATTFNTIIKEFDEIYANLQAVLGGTVPSSFDIIDTNKFNKSKKIKIVIGLILTVIIFSTGLFIKSNNLLSGFKGNIASRYVKTPEVIKDIEEFLQFTKTEKFTSDNITTEQAKKNNSLIKKIEKILEYQNIEEVQRYFEEATMSSDFLTNYLYNLQALASYYMYNMHDGDKARKILLYGKELAEHYVNSRSNIKINFNQLTNTEILSELQIVSDLSQIYTRIVYSLGRTYVYDLRKIVDGRQYFELSKYLGLHLGLFEGYLSDISGILVIERVLASTNIRKGEINIAKERLQWIIKKYAEMRSDNSSYILNYAPGATEQQMIIPSQHTYNLCECVKNIISSYNLLISISKKHQEIKDYIHEINRYLVGDESLVGLVSITANLPQKKLADLYNILGNLMINIWQLKEQENIAIDDENLMQSITGLIKTSTKNNLELAELLLNTAKDLSRNTDFTKADAYQGLARVYELKLKYQKYNLTDTEKQELEDKVSLVIQKSHLIHQKLNKEK